MTMMLKNRTIELEFHSSEDISWDEFIQVKKELENLGFLIEMETWANSYKALRFIKKLESK